MALNFAARFLWAHTLQIFSVNVFHLLSKSMETFIGKKNKNAMIVFAKNI